jgi:hypothetical protein
LLASTALGLALAPALFFFDQLFTWSQNLPQLLHWIVSGFGLAISFFIFGFSLLFVVSHLQLAAAYSGSSFQRRVLFFKSGALVFAQWSFLPGSFHIFAFCNLDTVWHMAS